MRRKYLLTVSLLILMIFLWRYFIIKLPPANSYIIVRRDILNIETMIKIYFIENGKYPESLEIFKGRLKLIDPWGNKYIYCYPSKRRVFNYDIISTGKDGRINTDDDIYNEGEKIK